MKYVFNRFALDTERFELTCQGEQVSLEPQVYSVLAYLLKHRHRVITKQELLDKLWEGKFVTESSLNTCIKAARKAVNDNGRDQNTIATIHRRGYRFVADAIETVEQQQDDDHEIVKPATHNSAGSQKADDRLSLVVIPFSHHPGDEEAAWWAEVFSEDISIHLARISGFKVISRHSAMALENIQGDPQKVGNELKTQYVIDGSVRKFKQEYRISVQLIDVKSGQLIWSNHKSLAVESIEDFQMDVVQKLVSRIEPELNRAEFSSLRHRQPADLGGWSLCREANAVLGQKGWSKTTFAEAINLLREAIRQDPELAFAHASLSLNVALGHLLGLVHQPDWQEEATRAAETALSLDSQNSDVLGHVGCAFADMDNFQRGIPLMTRALEINPANAAAWAALGAAKLRCGDESGVEDMRNGLNLSPRDNRLAAWGAVLARGLLSYGRQDEAIEAARNACLYDDKIFLPRAILTIALFLQGDKTGALNSWRDAQRILPGLSLDDITALAKPDELDQLRESDLF